MVMRMNDRAGEEYINERLAGHRRSSRKLERQGQWLERLYHHAGGHTTAYLFKRILSVVATFNLSTPASPDYQPFIPSSPCPLHHLSTPPSKKPRRPSSPPKTPPPPTQTNPLHPTPSAHPRTTPPSAPPSSFPPNPRCKGPKLPPSSSSTCR